MFKSVPTGRASRAHALSRLHHSLDHPWLVWSGYTRKTESHPPPDGGRAVSLWVVIGAPREVFTKCPLQLGAVVQQELWVHNVGFVSSRAQSKLAVHQSSVWAQSKLAVH